MGDAADDGTICAAVVGVDENTDDNDGTGSITGGSTAGVTFDGTDRDSGCRECSEAFR